MTHVSDPWLKPPGKHSKGRIVLKSLAPVVNQLTLKYFTVQTEKEELMNKYGREMSLDFPLKMFVGAG